MIRTDTKTPEKYSTQVVTRETTRLYFIDHLRAALIILVVLHHVALVYGGIQPFYYLEPPVNNLPAFLVPMAFVLMNQAWFMGALFLIAGFFTPDSFDRKGIGSFLKNRLIRLGIPLLFWIFVLNPISSIGVFLMPSSLTGITTPLTWQTFWKIYPSLIGLGPMWFVAMLLIFDFGYAAWRLLIKKQTSASIPETSLPSYLRIGLFILVLALLSYLTRIIVPLGESVLQFPTLAYLPQYLGFFIIGIIAYHYDWFRTIRGSMGVVGFIAAIVATIVLFPIGFISFLRAIEAGSQQLPPFGNGTWQSAIYAFWDTVFAVGMCLGAITFFRRFFDGQSSFGRFLSQQSYAVYIIHVPIIVFLVYALREIGLAPSLKFSIASLIALTICFIAAYIIRKIPGVSRVI